MILPVRFRFLGAYECRPSRFQLGKRAPFTALQVCVFCTYLDNGLAVGDGGQLPTKPN